jgi:serine/threonine protein kinase
MSPEQVVSEKDLDARADVWSLGVVLYECLAGVRPTEADNVGRVLKRILVADFTALAELRPDLPDEVSALVMKMLEGDREKRTRALADVRHVLEKHAGAQIEEIAGAPLPDAVVVVDRPSPTSFSRADTHRAVSVHSPKPARSPLRFVVAAAAALAVGIGLFAWRGSTSKPAASPETAAQAAPEPSAPPAVSTVVTAALPPASTSAPPAAPSAPPVKVNIVARAAVAPAKSAPAAVASATASVGTPAAAPVASAPPPKPASTLATGPKD